MMKVFMGVTMAMRVTALVSGTTRAASSAWGVVAELFER
jgi:hypothetical protein